MKQVLNFQSEDEFQNFFGQLSSAELPNFQAVEGSGGDMGFDGLAGKTAFQVFYPTKRTVKKYIDKIDRDLKKIIDSKDKLGLVIKKWIFIVPEDLRIEVIAHLQKKTKETKIECTHWGTAKLSELVNKHPHIKDAFPTIFLPPVRKGLTDLSETIALGQRPKVMTTVEVIADNEFKERRKMIQDDYKERTKSFVHSHGTSSSAHLQADMAYKKEVDKKIRELKILKERSDRAYKLELEEINAFWDSEIKKINEDMARRGIYQSGIRLKAVGEAEVSRKRHIAKLNLKFGKEGKDEQ